MPNKHRMQRIHARPKVVLLIVSPLLLLGVVCALLLGYLSNPFPSLIHYATTKSESFPAIDTTALSAKQLSLVKVLKSEFESQRKGEYYSEGATEAWCANFVSWTMRESGQPLKNPVSGSWRIPGTKTLKTYYQQQSAWRSQGYLEDLYQPRVGDVIFYAPSSIFGQHVNIVLKNENGTLTTIGGNEGGQVRVSTNKIAELSGIIGYGLLN
jgi:hypothetical protein